MIDLTDNNNGIHAINLACDKIITCVEHWSKMTADIIRKSPITTIEENYDNLYYDKDTITRSSKYTKYINDHQILRTHTTSMIPSEIRNTNDNRLIIAPGIVYRRDVIDKLHVSCPHQMDIWILNKERIGRKELLSLIDYMISNLLPNVEYRCNETIHPYTINGLEVEILIGDKWIELLECGEAHPWLLHDNGKDIGVWSGLAMGIGLDRLVMILKGMDDIRLLRSDNPKISNQMISLDKYKPVTKYNITKRDLSICRYDDDMEILGDLIRELDIDNIIEDITLIETYYYYDDVPDVAKQRLGIKEGQKNLLIRITLSSLSHDISKDEGNNLYNNIYSKIHQGTKGYI